MEILGKKGAVIVVSGPAGTGKNTLVDMLIKEFPRVKESVSCTTREPREEEVNGEHYHFLSREQFEARIAEGDFLEHAEVFANLYGTSRTVLKKMQEEGLYAILVIDTQGALQLRQTMPEATFVFIKPPSLEEARRRLELRKSETPEVIEQRLVWAERELAMAKYYDYVLVNNDLEIAYEVLRSIVIADSHRELPFARPALPPDLEEIQ